ncbi:energy-coupling factor ABC transporter permease [Photobacterium profundum]|uniref:energy-coupling factor ABC transporter permease n=1 Tax=Photobacterium profundum TaxID=74109 RepID=UPI003D124809
MTVIQWGGYLVGCGILLCNIPYEFWPKFKQDKHYQHLVFATVVILLLLWFLRAGIHTDLQVHFLGLTALMLIHGWRIAAFIGSLSLILMAVFGSITGGDIGIAALVGVIFPILFSSGIFLLSYRFLTHHIFIYIFVSAFINGALTMCFHLLLTSGLIYWVGDISWQYIVDNYLILMPLMAFPEALLNGMVMTLLIVYQPEWVRTFSEREYMHDRERK